MLRVLCAGSPLEEDFAKQFGAEVHGAVRPSPGGQLINTWDMRYRLKYVNNLSENSNSPGQNVWVVWYSFDQHRPRFLFRVKHVRELIDSTSAVSWQTVWQAATLGPNIRLLLGFDGAVAIDRASALRGKAFAENLINGNTFADSWISAVKSMNSRRRQDLAFRRG